MQELIRIWLAIEQILVDIEGTSIMIVSHCEYFHEREECDSNSDRLDGCLDDPFLEWFKRRFWSRFSLDGVQVKTSKVAHHISFLVF